MKTTLTALLAICLCLPLMGDDAAKKKFEETKAKAEKGDKIAQFNLGVMYAKGRGVPQDFKEAVKLYRKAAEKGGAFAQYNLGFLYLAGRGVTKNISTAYVWVNFAVANGVQRERAKNRAIIASRMTFGDRKAAQELSREMLKKNPKLLK